ncbi:MAG: ABC transporter ATP-binding protein [Burkholderiales bacterium]|jgi:iron(III) transport system ATP-binding protein|nr:ABC transporter ATP-binding protein [Burkholderiales bacterium]
MAAASLEVRALEHAYDHVPVVRGLSFAMEAGSIGCLLGPSGCGKTTVLRCVAGFEPVRGGSISLSGRVVSSEDANVPPEQRGIGMVFQDYALFPHLDVARNVAFGLERWTAAERESRTRAMLELVGLADAGRAWPHQLSGGQQQRVALARALAPKPGLLLLDEPFSNLDTDLRERLSLEVRAILKETGITAILVTHDQHEAFAIADEIGVMNAGALEQWASPYDLYHRPGTRFVADFIGQGVFVRGVADARGCLVSELGELAEGLPAGAAAGDAFDVLLRPDDIVHDDASPWRASVVAKTFRGAEFLYTLALASGTRVLAVVPSHHDHAIGEGIGIRLDIDHVVAFRASG